jgi:hypothetical protein
MHLKPDTKRQNFSSPSFECTSHRPALNVQHEMLEAKMQLLLGLPSRSMEGSEEKPLCTQQTK